jgi:long-chain fatty acid transport protein
MNAAFRAIGAHFRGSCGLFPSLAEPRQGLRPRAQNNNAIRLQGWNFMALRLPVSLRLAASVATLAMMATAASASSFAIRAGQSAEGLGMAFAGAASGGIGLGSMAWNPAAITMFPGRQSNFNGTYILPQARYRLDGPATAGGFPINLIPPPTGPGTQAGSAGIGLNGAFVPASYNVWQLTDRFFVGLTNTAPFGLRSKPGGDTGYWAGQTYGRSATVRTVNISPTVGFKVNDWISIGAALSVQFLQVDLKQALGIAANANALQLRGDSYQVGYRVGVTLTPWQGTSIGLAYRSGFDHNLRGQGRLFIPALGAALITPIKVNVPLPGSVVFGLSQQFNEQWQGHIGVEWTNWGRFGTLPVFNRATGAQYALPGAPPVPVNLRFNYKDSWFFSAGAEYRWNSQLTLRAGIGYELSAIDDTNRSPLISDNDRLWLSAGASYKFSDRLTFDIGYTYINVTKARFRYAPGDVRFTGVSIAATSKPQIHVVSAGLTYRWDDPTVAVPAAGVRK